MRNIRNSILCIAVFLIATEVGIRQFGLIDFPVYLANSNIGYIPLPNQSGAFLNNNTWIFNDRSMPTGVKWNASLHPNILLIGNSIFMGGNPYKQSDKIGNLLQQDIGENYSIWPIATGGWTNVNETVYLENNPDVVKAANYFVWEYMSGGLSQLSKWHGEYVFPSQKPIWATGYVVRRYILPKFIYFDMNELPPTGAVDAFNLTKFEQMIVKLQTSTGIKNSGILFLYPTKIEFLSSKNGVDWLPERSKIMKVTDKHNLTVVDLAKNPEWNENMYREGVHPSVEGNRLIARILADTIKSKLTK